MALPHGSAGTLVGYNQQALSGDFRWEESGKTLHLDYWRLRIFSHREELQDFRTQFQEYQDWFARGLKSTTYLRTAPGSQNTMKDYLTSETTVKVLDRQGGSPDQGLWWYLVLMEGGTTGWIPEDELDIQKHSPGMLPESVENLTLDPLMEKFFREIWRPADLLEQMSNHLVDPDELKDDHLLRGFREEKTLKLSLPGVRRTFTYTLVRRLPNQTYGFEGTGVLIRFSPSADTLTLYYPEGMEVKERVFNLLSENLGDIIARERARNREIYLQLHSLGPVLRSPGQGEIYLEKDQSFQWIPSPLAGETNGLPFFQKSYGNRGQVRLLLHLGEDLRTAGAQGVISLVFDSSPQTPVHFVYRLERGGLQLWQSQPPLPGILRIDTIEPETPSYFFSFSRT